MSKYDPKGKFNDPVLRCDSCQKLVTRQTIHKMGCCQHCGNRRFRTLTVFNDEEKAQMESWGIDPAFIAEFEGVTDE